MATPKRKSLGQINYEASVREYVKLEGGSPEEYLAWDDLDRATQKSYIAGAVAVQRQDRSRQRRDS